MEGRFRTRRVAPIRFYDGPFGELAERLSLWAHQTFPELAAFAWQEGYGAFSVSMSQEEAVKKNIAGQRDHH